MYHVVHSMYRLVHLMSRPEETKAYRQKLLEECLKVFIAKGTLDISFDELARYLNTSKRMLVHYFGNREELELAALDLFEERLRYQFQPEAFPAKVSLRTVVMALWKQVTASESQGALLLSMEMTRRGWLGSPRYRQFFEAQQEAWKTLLLQYSPKAAVVYSLLHLFQGAVLQFLVSRDPEPGRASLLRFLASKR